MIIVSHIGISAILFYFLIFLLIYNWRGKTISMIVWEIEKCKYCKGDFNCQKKKKNNEKWRHNWNSPV